MTFTIEGRARNLDITIGDGAPVISGFGTYELPYFELRDWGVVQFVSEIQKSPKHASWFIFEEFDELRETLGVYFSISRANYTLENVDALIARYSGKPFALLHMNGLELILRAWLPTNAFRTTLSLFQDLLFAPHRSVRYSMHGGLLGSVRPRATVRPNSAEAIPVPQITASEFEQGFVTFADGFRLTFTATDNDASQ